MKLFHAKFGYHSEGIRIDRELLVPVDDHVHIEDVCSIVRDRFEFVVGLSVTNVTDWTDVTWTLAGDPS